MVRLPICSCRCAFSFPGGSSSHLAMTQTRCQNDLLSLLFLGRDGCKGIIRKGFCVNSADVLPGHAVGGHLTLIITPSPPAHSPPSLTLSSLVTLATATTSRLSTPEQASTLEVLQGLQAHIAVRHKRAFPICANVGREGLEDGWVDSRVARKRGSTRRGCVHVAGREVSTCQTSVAESCLFSLKCTPA